MADFSTTDAGQYAGIAKSYLEGALILNVAQRDKGRILFRPTLALAGHGLELMLKACSFLNGNKPPTTGRKGHDVVSLWKADVCKPVQEHVFSNALRVAAEDRASAAYLGVPEDDEVHPLIEKFVIDLGKLHGGEGGYPLRYPSDTGKMAPRTPFLVKSLWAAADDLVKRPNEFELRYIHGKE